MRKIGILIFFSVLSCVFSIDYISEIEKGDKFDTLKIKVKNDTKFDIIVVNTEEPFINYENGKANFFFVIRNEDGFEGPTLLKYHKIKSGDEFRFVYRLNYDHKFGHIDKLRASIIFNKNMLVENIYLGYINSDHTGLKNEGLLDGGRVVSFAPFMSALEMQKILVTKVKIP